MFFEFVLLNAIRICFILDFSEAVDIKWGDFLSDARGQDVLSIGKFVQP